MRRIAIFVFIGILVTILYHGLWIADPLIAPIYDIITGQSPKYTMKATKAQLAKFGKYSYKQAMQDSATSSFGLEQSKYRKIYLAKTFMQINGFDRYQYLVGHYRVYEFLPEDRIIFPGIRIPIPSLGKRQYLLVSQNLLSKILMLINILRDQGLDETVLTITSGFRPPAVNKLVGGASQSRHLHGDAVDIDVGDVNRNGHVNTKDQLIVYNILNTKIIANRGGVGKYPHYNALHMDTRGHRARWSRYKAQ